jgi:hypothetical protein
MVGGLAFEGIDREVRYLSFEREVEAASSSPGSGVSFMKNSKNKYDCEPALGASIASLFYSYC